MTKFCSLVSGSSGNAVLVSDGHTHILVDCGLSGKRTMIALAEVGVDPAELSGILITHEHSDHISGVGVMTRRYGTPVYANSGTWSAMEQGIGKIERGNVRTFDTDTQFEIGGIGISAFAIPHDAAEPVGYSFFIDGKKISVATDIGYVSETVVNSIIGSETVMLEANHDVNMLRNGGYPAHLKRRILSDSGHLSNDCAAQIAAMLVQSGTTRIMLGHLSGENNIPCLAYDTVARTLADMGAAVGDDVVLGVAQRYAVSGIV